MSMTITLVPIVIALGSTVSTASLAAAFVCGHTGDSALLRLRGGELFIEWNREEDLLYMTGPAEFVFDGELFL